MCVCTHVWLRVHVHVLNELLQKTELLKKTQKKKQLLDAIGHLRLCGSNLRALYDSLCFSSASLTSILIELVAGIAHTDQVTR